MKFTGTTSNKRILPIMNMKIAPVTPAQNSSLLAKHSIKGIPASSWRQNSKSGEQFTLKSGCGCGG
jgi:hypothetical protein